MNIERIRELGHQIIIMISRSGLSIEEQSILVKSLESAFHSAVQQVAAGALENSN